jgi:hypothetical protein
MNRTLDLFLHPNSKEGTKKGPADLIPPGWVCLRSG